MRAGEIASATNTINSGLKRLADACANHGKGKVENEKPRAQKASKRGQVNPKTIDEDSPVAIAKTCSQAFQTLRNDERSSKLDFKLESVLVAFVGRSISLELYEVAHHELNLLHGRLQTGSGALRNDQGRHLQPLARLLPVKHNAKVQPELQGLLMEYHLLVIRLTIARPEAETIQALMPYLHPAHALSPTQTLRNCQSCSSLAEKVHKNAQLLSRLLSGLGTTAGALRPPKSSGDSPCMLRLKLQTMALQTRVLCGASQSQDLSQEAATWENFRVCLEQYARSSEPHPSRWKTACEAQNEMRTTLGRISPYVIDVPYGICQILAHIALQQGATDDALHWCRRILDCTDSSRSKLVHCAWTCTYAALALQVSPAAASSLASGVLDAPQLSANEDVRCRLRNVLEALNGPLSGSVTEFSAAVQEATRLRKAIVAGLKAQAGAPPDDLSASVLCAYVRFLSKYIGTCPDARDQFQLIKAGIESVVFSIKRRSKPVDCQSICHSLEACASLVDRDRSTRSPDCRNSASGVGTDEQLLLLISDSYWSVYTSDADGWPLKDEIRLLRGACDTLHSIKNESKEAARLPFKLYRLGKALQRLGNREEALQAFDGSVKAMLDGGMLNEPYVTPKKILRDQDSPKSRTFRNAVKSCIDLRLDMRAETTGRTPSLGQNERGLLMMTELQFELLLERAQNSSRSMKEAYAIGSSLLLSYDPTKHPLQHRRTIVQLLSIPSHPDIESDRARTLECARSLLKQPLPENLTQDINLKYFQTDIIASLHASVGLGSSDDAKAHLASALTLWEDVVWNTDSTTQMIECIEDPDSWIAQLEAIATYFELQEHARSRLTALKLLKEAHQLRDRGKNLLSSEIDMAITCHTIRSGFPVPALEPVANMFDQPKLVRMEILSIFRYQMHQLDLHLAQQSYSKCEHLIAELRDRYHDLDHGLDESMTNQTAIRKEVKLGILAELLRFSAMLQQQSGTSFETLLAAKRSASIFQYLWKRLTQQSSTKTTHVSEDDKPAMHALADDISRMSISKSYGAATSANHQPSSGPASWSLATKLFRSLLLVSNLSKHYGLYHDAVVAADQALVLAKAVAADRLVANALVALADASSRANQTEASTEKFKDASAIYDHASPCKGRAIHDKSLGYHNHLQRQWIAEVNAYDNALDVLSRIAPPASRADIKKQADAPESLLDARLDQSRKTDMAFKQVTTDRRKKGVRSKERGVAAVEVQVTESSHAKVDSRALQDVRNDITRSKADALIVQMRLAEAEQLLESIRDCDADVEQQSRYKTSKAVLSLHQAFSQIEKDTKLSMLFESTICYPSVDLTHSSLAQADNKRKAVPPRCNIPATSHDTGSLVEKQLAVVLKNGVGVGSKADVLLSNLLISRKAMSSTVAAMLQSMVNSTLLDNTLRPAPIGEWIENLRDVPTLREHQMTRVNNLTSKIDTAYSLPRETHVDLAERSGPAEDLSSILPTTWSVVSLTLSDDHNYLFVNRYLAGAEPTVLRIPISKQQAEESLEENFSFQEAMAELRDIICKSDSTIQQGRDGEIGTKVRSAKSHWWADREALDGRLKDLLANIEHMWLGGFRSILTDHTVDPSLLASFRQSFSMVLEKHLPSRQGQRKKTNFDPVRLSSQVLELFLGLGPPSDHDHDMEDSLTDLLYFIMDILHFNGEQNAYDEVDFDAMIVDTQDALQSYHDAARRDHSGQKLRHTILVLDKQLHAIPWESLPCLYGRSVSRLPSLVDLRNRINLMRLQQAQLPTIVSEGIHVPNTNGTYVLNPSCDLPKTQTRFSAPLSTLTETASWTAITGRAPTEAEFSTALTLQPPQPTSPCAQVDTQTSLTSQRICVYLGHGSGSHYIRPKRIKRLHGASDRSAGCATTLLFGCSSVALTTNGEFEPTGVPKTYLLAGAPAVLGALWDVTDGDCDAFAAGVLGRWGLVEQERLSAVKSRRDIKKSGKTRGQQVRGVAEEPAQNLGQEKGKVALSEAAAASKDDCYLKYLNGAAMVVYGVPVFLDR